LHRRPRAAAVSELLNARDSLMKSSKLLFIAAVATAYCATSSALSALTIVDARFYATAWDGVGSADEQLFTSLAFPAGETILGAEGGNSASLAIGHAGSGDQATFSYAFDQLRQGAVDSLAQGGGQVKFTVGADTTYALSGNYAASHLGGAGQVYFASFLYDLTAGGFLYNAGQISTNTADESFTLGGAGGDSYNGTTGASTGSLLAGHTYMFSMSASIQAYPGVDAGATAQGDFTLKIGGGAPTAQVPDSSSSLGCVALGLAALAAVRRRVCHG
jgi:hypothetical protein